MDTYHTTKTATRRWLVAIFCNILDCACINAYILYCKVTKTKISRDFLLALIKEICKPKVHPSDCLSKPVRQVISKAVMLQENVNSVSFLHVKKLFLTFKNWGKVCCKSHTGKKFAIMTCNSYIS